MLSQLVQHIHTLPRVALNPWPTPFMPMHGLRRALGSQCPGLWVKREDLTTLGGGGNKIRKLEFVAAKALAEQADVFLNSGEIQSNQVVQTAAVAARLGLACELFLSRTTPPLSEDDEHTGNILLARLLGAKIHIFPAGSDCGLAMRQRAEALRAEGRQPFIIPRGSTTPEGDAGAVLELAELLEQAGAAGFVPDAIVVTVGSSGTAAGFLAGLTHLARTGGPRIPLLAVDTFGPTYPQSAYERIMTNAEACWRFLGLPGACGDDLLRLELDFVGPGYAQPYPEMIRAIRLTAETEGFVLDPCYTGKCMTALQHHACTSTFRPDQNVVFLHSGGLPALFAMRRCFDPYLAGE